MLVNIEVDEVKILGGLRGWCSLCPVALAIDEVVIEGVKVVVTNQSIFLVGDARFRCDATEEAKRFIADFDSGESVTPFTFELDIPPEFLRSEPCTS